MDQVKAYLEVLKKHHFWVLVVIVTIAGVASWWMGASGLATDTQAQLNKVKGSFSELETAGRGEVVNESFAEAVRREHDELKQRVLADWQTRYDAQQQLFQWPAEIAEEMAKVNPRRDIPANVCALYKTMMLPKMEEVYLAADYRRPRKVEGAPDAADAAAGDGGQLVDPDAPKGPAGPPTADGDDALMAEVPEDGLVIWNPTHRASLDRRYDFFNTQGDPSSTSILLAQEDVWVLKQLAGIVGTTNEGAGDIFAATVKRIDSIDVAQWAIAESQRDKPRLSVAAVKTEAGAEGSGGMGGMGGNSTDGSEEPAADPSEMDEQARNEEARRKRDQLLWKGRYLNEQGQPIGFDDQPPYAEFKILFVRMKLVVDQRKVPQLLANCVNAPLPIEIRRVRIDEPLVPPLAGGSTAAPGAATGATPTSAVYRQQSYQPPRRGGGMINAARERAGGGAPAGGPGDQGRGDPSSAEGAAHEAGPFDVPVEICGVVYIYNRPDPESLGTGSVLDPEKRPSGMPTGPVPLPRGGASSSSGNDRGGRSGGGGMMNRARGGGP